MSLITLVQDFCRPTNIPIPTTVLSNTDEQVQQIYGLLLEECQDLITRGDWQQLVREATHTTVATESQGNINTIAPYGFERFKHETFWNRSNNLQIYISNSTEWQQIKAVTNTGPNYQVYLRGNILLANPVPTAGLTWAFEYVSNYYITSSDGATARAAFESDTDLILFPERIVKLGLRWRWKKEKGLEYAEDFRTYEMALKQALGSNGLRKKLDMSGYTKKIGVSIPEGSWNV